MIFTKLTFTFRKKKKIELRSYFGLNFLIVRVPLNLIPPWALTDLFMVVCCRLPASFTAINYLVGYEMFSSKSKSFLERPCSIVGCSKTCTILRIGIVHSLGIVISSPFPTLSKKIIGESYPKNCMLYVSIRYITYLLLDRLLLDTVLTMSKNVLRFILITKSLPFKNYSLKSNFIALKLTWS